MLPRAFTASEPRAPRQDTLLHVVGGDIDNVVLSARTGSVVTGSFVTDAGERPPFPASGVRVNLRRRPANASLPTVRLPDVDND